MIKDYKNIKGVIEVTVFNWFDKVNGSSYFSARAYINNEIVSIQPFQYGYGGHAIEVIFNELKENKVITTDENTLRKYCCMENIYLNITEKDAKKKVMKSFGIDHHNELSGETK